MLRAEKIGPVGIAHNMNREKTIWILEDDPEAILIYEQILELRYKFRIFPSFGEFRKSREECGDGEGLTPDLVIADLRLTDGNFLNFLSSEEAPCHLPCPFIVVSSCDDLDVLRTCFEEGALDFLIKPFKKSEFIVKIERYLNHDLPFLVEDQNVIHFDPRSLSVRRGPEIITQLTARELQIFAMLQRFKGLTVPRESLIFEVWRKTTVTQKTLDVHLFNLRKKLRDSGMDIKFIPEDGYLLSNCPPMIE